MSERYHLLVMFAQIASAALSVTHVIKIKARPNRVFNRRTVALLLLFQSIAIMILLLLMATITRSFTFFYYYY